MELFDSQQKSIRLGQEIGRGGEATVYQVFNQPGVLAKIYKRSPGADYRKKLVWMQRNPPQDPTRARGHASIAWPLDLVYDRRGQFVGYLMPRIRNATSLLDVFNPRRRKQTLPGFNQKYLHRTARNLATALAALHSYGYIVGDLNESNIMVTPSALVTLIDTDSFQITVKEDQESVVYPCPVGKPEYTPPELQGQSFRQTYRRPEHDRFGLATLIFQLLMNGSHPFRARWLGRGDPPPIEERISRGCYPYLKKPPCAVAPPQNATSLTILDPKLVQLFHRCFVDGHRAPEQRPSPDVWARRLASVEERLVECSSGHYYASHLANCPQCQLAKHGSRSTGRLQRPNVATPPARPIIATPAAHPGSTPLPTIAPPRSDIFRRRWQIGMMLAAIGILIYGSTLIVLEFIDGNSLATTPTGTPQPTFTPLPTAVRLEAGRPPPPVPPTDTPLPSSTPTPSATPTPPPPVVTAEEILPSSTPTSSPTVTSVPGDPEITIMLPEGNSYAPGDDITVMLSFKDPNGVGNVFFWVTDATKNNSVRLRQRHWCNNQVDCLVTESFTNLPSGTFNIFVSAFDNLENGTVREAQIVVR